MDKELQGKLGTKRIAKYIAVVILILFAVSLAMRFSIESADSKKEKNAAEKGESVTATIEIRCDELINNMDKVKNKSLIEYIPEDGVILAETVYEGNSETSVFDVLEYVCRENNIHMEFEYNAVYESNYVSGINYLYEFDAGAYSGWTFKVNGKVPNYGSSSIYIEEGDKILWIYTCEL